jgi:hypothetical protein
LLSPPAPSAVILDTEGDGAVRVVSPHGHNDPTDGVVTDP